MGDLPVETLGFLEGVVFVRCDMSGEAGLGGESASGDIDGLKKKGVDSCDEENIVNW
jgi:hypothetical protein